MPDTTVTLSLKVYNATSDGGGKDLRKTVTLPGIPLAGDFVGITSDNTSREVVVRDWIVGSDPVIVLSPYVSQDGDQPGSNADLADSLMSDGWLMAGASRPTD